MQGKDHIRQTILITVISVTDRFGHRPYWP